MLIMAKIKVIKPKLLKLKKPKAIKFNVGEILKSKPFKVTKLHG